MKKKVVGIIAVLILIVLVAFIAYSNYTKEKITGEAVTGEATGESLAISVSVMVSAPSLTIISPENETYIRGENLQLDYSATNVYSIWYNLDNTANTTITGNTTFDVSEGIHTLYIYANNTNGNITSDNITFIVDSSKFRVYYDKYKNQGNSTNFDSSSYENLHNLEEIILEIPNQGKIEFSGAINLTENSNYDNECDLDSYTNISSNYIEINSTALPNFNTSATLYLYNLTFLNPRILRDSSVCSDTVCTEISYSEGTLIFSVPHFTTYSTEETPSTPTQQTNGGGGSGTAIISTIPLSISPEFIGIKINQGEKITKNIIIINEGKQNLKVNIENPKLKDFIKISETNFTLVVGETKVVALDITANESYASALYMGNLIISAKGLKKEIFVLVEVESKSPLFDVNLKIPKKSLYVSPGKEVSAEINLYNLAGTKKVDVLVEYSILNKNADEIFREQETIAVETSKSFVKSFRIPKDAHTGKYFLYIRTTYDGLVASASSQFNVGAAPLTWTEQILFMIIGILIVLVFIILIIILYKFKKKKKIRKEGKKIKESFKYYKKRLKEKIEKHKK